VDDRRPPFPLDEPCEAIGSGAAPAAGNIHESSPVAYCGTDRQVSEAFAVALRIMGLDADFLPLGSLTTNSPSTEDH
jgi:hypothetical protein